MNSNVGNAFVQTSKQDKLFSAANDAIFYMIFKKLFWEKKILMMIGWMICLPMLYLEVWFEGLKGLKSLDDKTITDIQVGGKVKQDSIG
ncbi:MAG: hypothetical protein ACTTGU_04990 [Moraxella sp.]